VNTDPRLIAFARAMRHEPTSAERLAWRLLRGHRLAGFRFRRQHPIPPYIADFYCAVAKLVIELDGESHVGQEENDAIRQAAMESNGLKVLRFWNSAVNDDPDTFTATVYEVCIARTQADPIFAKRISERGQFRASVEPRTPTDGESG